MELRLSYIPVINECKSYKKPHTSQFLYVYLFNKNIFFKMNKVIEKSNLSDDESTNIICQDFVKEINPDNLKIE